MRKKILYGSENVTEEEKQYKGILKHLTVYKIAKVNPNTASEEVLNILFTPEQAKEIIGNKSSKGYHSNSLSNVFQITSTGKIENSRTEHTIEAVVEKFFTDGKPHMVIHYWNDNVLKL